MRRARVALLLLVCTLLAGCTTDAAPPTAALGNREAPGGSSSAGIPVFPGAEGFGTDTPAGRGGRVLVVTNLRPRGPGSLRAAVESPGPRTVLFAVAGAIRLTTPIRAAEPFLTIAGQTAPDPGITLLGAGLLVQTHDVLIRHLSVRPGDDPAGPSPSSRDGLAMVGAADGALPVHNVVIDQCSVSWAVDEGMSTWHPGVHDITVRNCIIAENLSRSLHPEGEHSKGFLIGDHARRVAVIGNLFAHNMRRNPLIKGDVSAYVAGNVIYDYGTAAIHLADPEGSGPAQATILGNVAIPGPSTRREHAVLSRGLLGTRGAQVYAAENRRAVGGTPPHYQAARGGPFFAATLVQTPPLSLPGAAPAEPAATVRSVLATAGSRPARRGPVDLRIIENVRRRSGRIIDSVEQVGGMPEIPETRHELAVPANPAEDDDGDGYTNLEEWLHEQSALTTSGG
jgi:hypothetical protein